jgi:hypothetical protein
VSDCGCATASLHLIEEFGVLAGGHADIKPASGNCRPRMNPCNVSTDLVHCAFAASEPCPIATTIPAG